MYAIIPDDPLRHYVHTRDCPFSQSGLARQPPFASFRREHVYCRRTRDVVRRRTSYVRDPGRSADDSDTDTEDRLPSPHILLQQVDESLREFVVQWIWPAYQDNIQLRAIYTSHRWKNFDVATHIVMGACPIWA